MNQARKNLLGVMPFLHLYSVDHSLIWHIHWTSIYLKYIKCQKIKFPVLGVITFVQFYISWEYKSCFFKLWVTTSVHTIWIFSYCFLWSYFMSCLCYLMKQFSVLDVVIEVASQWQTCFSPYWKQSEGLTG